MEYFISKLEYLIPEGILNYEIFGNTVGDFILSFVVFLLLSLFFKIVQSIVIRRLNKFAEKTKTDIDDAFIRIVKSIRPPFYLFLSLYISFRVLNIPEFGLRILDFMLLVWAIYQAITAVQILIDYIVKKAIRSEDEADSRTAISFVSTTSKVVLWSIGLLLILSNLGFNISAIIAGLGIGGIAIAFALQNILADLFSSLAIYLDKPFRVGDFIAVGTDKGTVEKIGIKTTRLTSLQGEELVISNQELTNARLQNFKNMDERRVSFNFGVTYETENKKLKSIPKIVSEIIDNTKMAYVDRVHFLEFGDSSLNFSVVYYVESREYIDYADVQQEINFAIRDKFEKDGIEMAYPTSTIYLAKTDG